MPRLAIPFADGFYQSQSRTLLDKRVVNLVPIVPEADAPSRKVLVHTDGITQFADVAGSNSRGVLRFSDGKPYRVIGNSLYSFDSAGTATNHGTVTGTSDVGMDSNGINIAIVDPKGDSYFFTPSTGILESNNGAVFLSFGQATSVAFKDGSYVYTTDSIFFTSSPKTVNDGKDFNALDFADAEISPDIIIKAFNDHNQMYILGSDITEVYRTIVTEGFTLQRIAGAMIPKGCAARNTVIPFDNSFLFMGGGSNERPAIYRAVGSGVQRISTRSIERIIQAYPQATIAEARAFSYSVDGSYFAVFEIGNNTFVYDQTATTLTGKPSWHERQSGITNATGFQKWRAIHGIEAFGKIQVGDDRSGLVGELDPDVFKEYGDPIERFWTTKPFQADGDPIYSHEIELYMETGLGNDDVEEPVIRHDYSDDGSRTFTNEITKSLGKKGKSTTRLRWKRKGRFPNTRVLRWKTTAPVPINIFGLFANAEATGSG
jgi:hypothetical protein